MRISRIYSQPHIRRQLLKPLGLRTVYISWKASNNILDHISLPKTLTDFPKWQANKAARSPLSEAVAALALRQSKPSFLKASTPLPQFRAVNQQQHFLLASLLREDLTTMKISSSRLSRGKMCWFSNSSSWHSTPKSLSSTPLQSCGPVGYSMRVCMRQQTRKAKPRNWLDGHEEQVPGPDW